MVRGRFLASGGLGAHAWILLSIPIVRWQKVLFKMRPTFGGIVQSPSWRVSVGAERVRRYETPDTRRRVSSTTAPWSLSGLIKLQTRPEKKQGILNTANSPAPPPYTAW
jgi:hypothetical protein